jgi:hypothetical protein
MPTLPAAMPDTLLQSIEVLSAPAGYFGLLKCEGKEFFYCSLLFRFENHVSAIRWCTFRCYILLDFLRLSCTVLTLKFMRPITGGD